uniref:Uncharacterized protein n=1 Tax=Phenylobacterium glaciei TaxID=2803784 RepID=A0A974P602_9CAUL|nr:hypothetical protein JKL49_09005 [Phenylobacterium glaciei]
MTRPPVKTTPEKKAAAAKPKAAGKTPAAIALEVASKPVEAVGHTIERALEPLNTALKRATQKRADKQAEPAAPATRRPPRAPCRSRPGRAVPEDPAHRRGADRHQPRRLLQA